MCPRCLAPATAIWDDTPPAGAAPDVAGEVVGWRTWTAHDGHLSGLGYGHVAGPWPAAEPAEAKCLDPSISAVPHNAPYIGCTCGVHAWRDSNRAVALAASVWHGGPVVFGTVRLWGRLVEHEDGWRAQYAYPDLLWANSDRVAAAVSERYGVPCRAVTVPLVGTAQPKFGVRPPIVYTALVGAALGLAAWTVYSNGPW